MLTLPRSLRAELKDPLGPVYTDPEALFETAGTPIVAVGDVVTEHLLSVTTPSVALVDGQTKRTPLDTPVDLTPFDRKHAVENPAATLSREMLETLSQAIDDGETTAIVVDGEEDLAALPAIIAAPLGASVVYGQPDAGMVLVTVEEQTRSTVCELLTRMDGDHEAVLGLLEGAERE
ncbi:GTP-dependent dephospho-CoA kinase family protein [Halocatena pleomorpha]|uniref:GTP-dependent dephospho-CoA kinase n=1 Tax=Halocatena pleomorpha TaxID=1785090 RepID=A0A3P3R596_9EURY|nr:DUF359 domain-containing protein [Halocatena pleomorpha]RRJ27820.1 DUF359 domain-containing protein [Halocatena pleomorpha]